MPRGIPTFGRDEELISFVSGQIFRVQENLGLTITELAQVAGYERSAFHRMLRGDSLCNTAALYRLSVHYNLPMDYWLPPRQGAEVYTPPKIIVREGSIPTMLPLTRQMINKLNKLPKDAKRHILVLALQSPELVPDAIAVAKILAQLGVERKKQMMRAMAKIAKETCQPAP
jgi:AraC-like DNA-binding protein